MKVRSHFANASTSSDLATSTAGNSESDMCFLLRGGMVVVAFGRDHSVWIVLMSMLVFFDDRAESKTQDACHSKAATALVFKRYSLCCISVQALRLKCVAVVYQPH